MFPVSSAFLSAVTKSHIAVVRITTGDGVSLSASEGSVSMDATRSIERTCDLTLVPTADLTAEAIYQLVMQPATEIVVERGIVVNGVAEYVELGTFSTDTADIDKAKPYSVAWSGSDRSKKVSRARFTDPYVIAAGISVATAAADLIVSRRPLADTDFSNVTETTPVQVVYEAGADSDPWQHVQEYAADLGYYLRFGGDGVARAVVVPDPATAEPVFSFGSGSTNIVTGAELKGTLEETYNGVIASGEGTEVEADTSGATPVTPRFDVWDDDPDSPTYYLGGMGKVPYFYTSSLLTTVAMCETAARSRLAKVKGVSEQLSWPSVVNPALEPLDVVTVTVAGVTHTLVIDSLTIPLKASDAMTANARETRRSLS